MYPPNAILARFPGPVTLTPSRWLLWFAPPLMAGGTVFSVYLLIKAIEAGSSEIIYAGLAVIVFGFFTIRTLIRLLPGHTSLTLDSSGFHIRNAYVRSSWLWRNVSNFRVEVPNDDRLPDRVIFDVAGKKPLRGSAGGGSLPEGSRLRLADLATLMNAWRERALALPRTTSSVPHVGQHPR
jgi:hypothetical protein